MAKAKVRAKAKAIVYEIGSVTLDLVDVSRDNRVVPTRVYYRALTADEGVALPASGSF